MWIILVAQSANARRAPPGLGGRSVALSTPPAVVSVTQAGNGPVMGGRESDVDPSKEVSRNLLAWFAGKPDEGSEAASSAVADPYSDTEAQQVRHPTFFRFCRRRKTHEWCGSSSVG